MKRTTFAIVSLGLIGGSLAMSIRKRFGSNVRVVGFSRSKSKALLAKREGLIHEGFSNLSEAVSTADLIFVCSPVNLIPELVSKIDRFAKKGAVVTDVGSTKESIVRWARRQHFRKIEFVGSHPLAGSHLAGLEHARPDLFCGATVFVTPINSPFSRGVRVVSAFWKKLGAQIQVLPAKTHDQIVSEISHLPHALASILINTVSGKSLRYAASGFLDTTRVAQGDPQLWTPIFLANRHNLILDLKRFEKVLNSFLLKLKRNSSLTIHKFLKSAAQKRNKSVDFRKK